jgi:UDP-N-acetylmuramoyl-tripeptide--D-alanyl-D-alanine ligase
VAVGPRGRWIADAARSGGLRAVIEADDGDAAGRVVELSLAPGVGDVLLVKASRGVELDRLVDALAADRSAVASVHAPRGA